ncbi:MAG: ASCH domain-containing protein [Lutispora sp.]|nr:ASCH domain-containing protein [Lutispora sp.]
MKVLLSIKPEFVDKIIKGEKKYEYRKRGFKENVDTVVIYSTKPVGKIIGEFEIQDIINYSPIYIWSKTYRYSGVSEDFFMKYFEDKNEGFALEIGNLMIYDNPIDPKVAIENFFPPQSFMYIEDNLF